MYIDKDKVLVGADPEFFLLKNLKPVSAFGLIKGTKEAPFPVKKGAVQVDGMACEFNIDPAKDEEEFVLNLNTVQKQLMDMVPDHTVSVDSSINFSKEVMQQQPGEALELGCSPDFNSVTGTTNPSPSSDSQTRTAGGHVHIGGFDTNNVYSNEHFEDCRVLTNLMDEQLGVYSVLWDDDDQRRKMYGKASCFRPKPYGMEYRTLSNKWIFNSDLVRLVYRFTMDAVEQVSKSTGIIDPLIRKIINTSDRDNPFFKNNRKADMVKEMVGV